MRDNPKFYEYEILKFSYFNYALYNIKLQKDALYKGLIRSFFSKMVVKNLNKYQLS